MNPGKLRHQVHLQASARAADEGGGGGETWADVAGPLYAEVRPLDGGEAVRGLQLSATVTHQVRMRWRAGVTSALRARFGARVFEIPRGMHPAGRHGGL